MTSHDDDTASSPPRLRRFLSGVQPSGRLHLGNYFGAIRGHIDAQELPQTECFYFIANYHSLTTIQDRERLLENTREVAVSYLALGLDPERTVFYRQSDVPEVTELTWILSTCVGMGLLERAHSYKDKIARGLTPSVGLFTYPVLMAADILGPQSDVVPVGKDQQQHVEMTRDMAAAFNSVYCQDREPVFKLPEVRFTEIPKVPGTTFDKGSVAVVTYTLERLPQERYSEVRRDAPAVIERVVDQLKQTIAERGIKMSEQLEAPAKEAAESLLKGAFPFVELKEVRVRTADSLDQARTLPGEAHEGDLFLNAYVPVPEVLFLSEQGKRVAAKMSKSYGNTIEIFAEGKPLKKAVMGIETDKTALEDPLDPDDDLVFALYRLFATEAEQEEMRHNYRAGGYGYGNAKKALLAKVNEHFAEAREKRKQLLEKPNEIEEILQEGAKKARQVISATTQAARDACGLPRNA